MDNHFGRHPLQQWDVCSACIHPAWTLVFALLTLSLLQPALPVQAQLLSPPNLLFLPMISDEHEPAQLEPLQTTALDPYTIFSADFETGDYSQWYDGGRIAISGIAWPTIQPWVVRSGRYATALSIYFPDGSTSPEPGVRLAWDARGRVAPSDPKNLPDEAYYSAHYFLPHLVLTEWWNLMQWKQYTRQSDGSLTRIPVYTVSANYADQQMWLRLRSKVAAEGNYTQPGATAAISPKPIPIASWVRLECLYRWSKEPAGRIACWQDGELVWDVNNIVTEFDLPNFRYPRQWTVNNYAGSAFPPLVTIFLDDAAIRTQPLDLQ
jgi:hypothetical protein